MAKITLKGNPINTSGDLPAVGSDAPAFTLVNTDLAEKTLADYAGKKVILNVFPSIDTPVCATSEKTFSEKVSGMDGVEVLCISCDLPFAQKRFCAAEGVENVTPLSAFRSDAFCEDYGVKIVDGPLAGLCARAVVVINEEGKVTHSELVPEIAQEPDYKTALEAVS